MLLYYLCKYVYTLLWLKCVTIKHSYNRLCISWYVPILKRLKCWCKTMTRWRWYSAEVAVLCPKQKITTDAWRTDEGLQRTRFKSKARGFTVNVDDITRDDIYSGFRRGSLFIPVRLCWSLILKRFESSPFWDLRKEGFQIQVCFFFFFLNQWCFWLYTWFTMELTCRQEKQNKNTTVYHIHLLL